MANGILGSQDLAAVTYTLVYTVPASTFGVASVSFCNKNATSITVRLAVAKPGEALPQADDYLEYETEILPNGVLERTGIVLEAGRQVFAHTSTSNTVCMVSGIETATV
jgi:hypothetical protein